MLLATTGASLSVLEWPPLEGLARVAVTVETLAVLLLLLLLRLLLLLLLMSERTPTGVVRDVTCMFSSFADTID